MPSAPSASEPGLTADLRLLATTDLHAHLMPYDYFRDCPDERIGLLRLAGQIAAARAESANCLLFDNGDLLQGSPMGDYMAETMRDSADPHPMIAAMNHLGYDAGTLGNHEFNFGLDFLGRVLADAEFPLVTSNIHRCAPEDGTLCNPALILPREVVCRNGETALLRIGVLGFAPPQIEKWDRAHVAGHLRVHDIALSAAALVPGLRAAGADVVIALCHSGLGDGAEEDRPENAALALAQVPGIDAIVAGHTHGQFPPDRSTDAAPAEIIPGIDPQAGLLNGVAAVMPGHFGSHLGVIDLELEQAATSDGGWRVTQSRSRLRPAGTGPDVAPAPPDPALLHLAAPAHARTLDYVRRPVGHCAVPLDSFLSLVENTAALHLIADAQCYHFQREMAGRPEAALPLLSAAAPYRVGGRGGPQNFTDIPAGPLSLRHVSDLYCFPNLIRAVRVNGDQLQDWLERSAALFSLIRPGIADQPLHQAAFPSYNFDVIFGLTYRIDPGVAPRYDSCGQLCDPAASRIRDLSYRGQPVRPDQEFAVVTNSYRLEVSGLDAEVIYAPGHNNRDVLRRHIEAAPDISPVSSASWSLCPVPGASALFRSSPRLLDDPARLKRAGIEALGLDAAGFVLLRKRL